MSIVSENTIRMAAFVAAISPSPGHVERTRGGVVSGGSGAVSKVHTRQSQDDTGPEQAPPPIPSLFWSRRFPARSRAVDSTRTV